MENSINKTKKTRELGDVILLEWPENCHVNISYMLGSFVPDPTGKTICEGPTNAYREIVNNAQDAIFDDPNADTLIVDIKNYNGYYMVGDNGPGIPIKMSEVPGKTMARLSITALNAGSKFTGYRKEGITIGRHGVGASCTAAISQEYILLSKITPDNYNKSIPEVKQLWESQGPRSKKDLFYIVVYTNYGLNFAFEGAMKLQDINKKLGVNIPSGLSTIVLFKFGNDNKFVPDPRVEIPIDSLNYFQLILKEFYKRKINIIVNGEKLETTDLTKNYRYRISKTIIPEDQSLNKKADILIYFDIDPEMSTRSYFGSINALDCNSGSHISFVENSFSKAIQSYYNIKHKYTTNGLRLCVVLLIDIVSFDSQTKVRARSLGKIRQSDFDNVLIKEFTKIFKSDPEFWDVYVEKLNYLADSMKALSVSDKVQKMIEDSHGKAIFKSKSDLIPGFSDATGKDRWECELFLCFTGDTEILTYDNEKISFIDLVKRIEDGEEIYTYSCTSSGERRKSKIIAAKKIKKVKHLVKVSLGEYGSFECTPDHKIMMLNGTYKEAKDLIIGDDLMTVSGSVKLLSIYLHWSDDEDVYCLEVDDPEHNFSLAVGGLFAKNCEGLSPAGSLKAGRPDTSKYAILPLRGKIKGTVDSSMEDALENKEIKTIFSVIGLGMGEHNVTSEAKTQEEAFELIRKYSRYGKIIIAVD